MLNEDPSTALQNDIAKAVRQSATALSGSTATTATYQSWLSLVYRKTATNRRRLSAANRSRVSIRLSNSMSIRVWPILGSQNFWLLRPTLRVDGRVGSCKQLPSHSSISMQNLVVLSYHVGVCRSPENLKAPMPGPQIAGACSILKAHLFRRWVTMTNMVPVGQTGRSCVGKSTPKIEPLVSCL